MTDQKLSDGEIACMDAIKTILEVLIARNISSPQELAELYRYQSNGYLQKKMPVASAAMLLLVQFLESPQRKAIRSLLQKPPEGNA